MQIGYDNCKGCVSGCEHAGKDREFVYSAGKGSCKVKQPKADLVSVVRCRECRYYTAFVCAHPGGMELPSDSDYCSRGERCTNQSVDVRNMGRSAGGGKAPGGSE